MEDGRNTTVYCPADGDISLMMKDGAKTSILPRRFEFILYSSSGGLAIWSTGSFLGGPLYNVGRPFA